MNGRKLLVVIASVISEGLRLYSQILDTVFDNIKRHPKHDIFKCISWPNCLFYSGDERDILKVEVKTYLGTQSSPLDSIFLFICTSIVYAWRWLIFLLLWQSCTLLLSSSVWSSNLILSLSECVIFPFLKSHLNLISPKNRKINLIIHYFYLWDRIDQFFFSSYIFPDPLHGQFFDNLILKYRGMTWSDFIFSSSRLSGFMMLFWARWFFPLLGWWTTRWDRSRRRCGSSELFTDRGVNLFKICSLSRGAIFFRSLKPFLRRNQLLRSDEVHMFPSGKKSEVVHFIRAISEILNQPIHIISSDAVERYEAMSTVMEERLHWFGFGNAGSRRGETELWKISLSSVALHRSH